MAWIQLGLQFKKKMQEKIANVSIGQRELGNELECCPLLHSKVPWSSLSITDPKQTNGKKKNQANFKIN